MILLGRENTVQKKRNTKNKFLSYINSSLIQRTKVTSTSKEKQTLPIYVWMTSAEDGYCSTVKNARYSSGVIKTPHDLRQFLILHTMNTLRDKRGRWHCSGEFVFLWQTWGVRVNNISLLNEEDDELKEGPWHRAQHQPSDENLLKEAEGRQLGSALGSLFWPELGGPVWGRYSTFSRVKHKP